MKAAASYAPLDASAFAPSAATGRTRPSTAAPPKHAAVSQQPQPPSAQNEAPEYANEGPCDDFDRLSYGSFARLRYERNYELMNAILLGPSPTLPQIQTNNEQLEQLQACKLMLQEQIAHLQAENDALAAAVTNR